MRYGNMGAGMSYGGGDGDLRGHVPSTRLTGRAATMEAAPRSRCLVGGGPVCGGGSETTTPT